MNRTKDGDASSLTRRRFLLHGGAAAAAVAGLGALPAPPGQGETPANPGQDDPVRSGEPANAAQDERSPARAAVVGPPAPPAPTREVYAARMDAARGLMQRAQVDILLEPPGSNMHYLTGLSIGRSERLTAFLLPLTGPPMFICPAFERGIVETSPAGVQEIRTWEEDEDAIDILEKYLKKSGLADKKMALGSRTWYDEMVQINEALPKLGFISTTPIVGYLRERKSPAEIEILKAAAGITQKAIERAFGEVREGMREEDLAALITSYTREMGARGEGLVQFGPRTAVPHNVTSDRRLAAGDVILVDFGAQLHGYWSDISRPAVLGKADGRMKLIHETIRRAQDLAAAKAKPGQMCVELDQVARSTLGGRGFLKFFLHRLGHGIGLDGHEPPYLSRAYYERLAEGNVVTLEPGVYTPGEYGIRIEDMLEVTASGARLLSKPPDSLLEI